MVSQHMLGRWLPPHCPCGCHAMSKVKPVLQCCGNGKRSDAMLPQARLRVLCHREERSVVPLQRTQVVTGHSPAHVAVQFPFAPVVLCREVDLLWWWCPEPVPNPLPLPVRKGGRGTTIGSGGRNCCSCLPCWKSSCSISMTRSTRLRSLGLLHLEKCSERCWAHGHF